jgi:hypothetical protein
MQFKNVDVLGGPKGLSAVHDILYLNEGGGTFRDATDERGCRPPRAAYGLGTVILDFDDDGDQDVFVGNDSMPNFLFVNDGSGRFVESGLRSGLAANGEGGNQATMGIAAGDVDGNGLPDLFSTNFSSDTNTLHLNLDGRFFEDATRRYGLGVHSRPYLGWACAFLDLDHDGDEDLIVFNGHVYPEATAQTMDSEYRQEPLLYRREGPRFERIGPEIAGPWLAERHCDRAAAFGDLDGDGDVDVAVGELNGPVQILRNDATGPWVTVELRDERSGNGNHRGLGGKVVLTDGATRQTRWIHSGGSFQSSSAPIAHFGIAGESETVDLEVTWPDGTRQEVKGVEVGQRVVVRRE